MCGHITKEVHTINDCLTQFLFVAEVITVVPESFNGDFIISEKQLRYAIGNKKREAIVIRTLPNTKDKLSQTILLYQSALFNGGCGSLFKRKRRKAFAGRHAKC